MNKKTVSFFLGAAVLAMTACSSSNKSAEADTANDSSLIDLNALASEPDEEKIDPMEALELKPGKNQLYHPEECYTIRGKWTMLVTNTSSVAIPGSAYAIQYKEDVEETVNGELVGKTLTKTAPGVDVNPGETVEIDIRPTKDDTLEIREPKLIATEETE